MAMIHSSAVNNEEIHPNNRNSNENDNFISMIDKDESDISKCDNEVHNRKGEENFEENSRNVVCITLSSGDNHYSHKKAESNEISNITVNNSFSIDRSDINESGKEHKLKVNTSHDEDNDNDTTKKISKRFLNLIDSDSEEETALYETLKKESLTINNEHHSGSYEHLQMINRRKNFKNIRIIDSESEEDTQTDTVNGFSQTDVIINGHQTLTDSESENEKKVHNSITASEESDISEDNKVKKKFNNYQALVDPESEEEREIVHNSLAASEENGISENKDASKKLVKKRKGSVRASRNEAMRKIHSENQRLLRETEIFLPYHRPKQRTLQEFLNRKIISTALPKAPSTAAKLKMSSAIVSQVLAEKEKEAELFYKSSDSEDDTQQQPMPFSNKDINKSNRNEEIFSTESNRVDTLPQKITDEYQQNLQKLGVSRKLFDTYSRNETNKDSDMNHNVQGIVKEIIETIITSLDKEKCTDDQMKPKIDITDNNKLKMLQEHQDDNEDKDKNLIVEATRRVQDSSNVGNEKIIETLEKNDRMRDDVIASINSDDCVVTKDKNNERKSKSIEMDDVSSILCVDTPLEIQDYSLTEKCEESNGHVLGLPLPKFTDETLIDKKKLLLTSIEKNSRVTLKGSPGMIIDLTDDAKPNRNGVNTLLDRFFYKHVNTRKPIDSKSEVTVVHLKDTENGPLPIKEVLPYKISLDIDNPELSKPGAKLMRLKEDLKLQMILKRNKEWKHKEIETQAQEKEEWEEEESDYDINGQERDNYLDLIDSEESEPEEDDIHVMDKKRDKCLFADDEAEVTDDDCSSVNTEDMCNESDIDQAERNDERSTNIKYRSERIDDDISELETDQEEENDLNADRENSSESEFKDDNVDVCKRRKSNIIKDKNDKERKRLIEQPRDDSNSNYSEEDGNKLRNTTTDMSKTHCEDNGWMSESESNMPVYQQHAEATTRNYMCKTPLTKTSMLDFVSPITQLSVLNTTLDSNKKNSLEEREYLDDNHESAFMESTHSDAEISECKYNVKNKTVLKKKLFDDVEETVDDEYLMQLCSGKFDSTQKTDSDLFSQCNTTKSSCPTNIGTQFENTEMENENIKLTLDEDSHDFVNCTKEVIAPELKLKIVSSDDEDEGDTFLKPKKRSAKRINLSDSEEESARSSDEENDDIDDKEADERYIDYDSEENEVMVSKKDIKRVAADFLEEEAELSESDWNSADEDERDLDKLEFEEADDEHIDEHKVKDQLEKIHMKQMLDEDKREVRLLKELLFEDGDLHTDGAGRERKFKWRNIDKLGTNIEMSQAPDENDGWVDMQEDEEEARWSKLKRERDKFLEERTERSNNEIEDELCNSQIFKLGLNALRKIKDNKSQRQESPFDETDTSENMEPIMPRNITDLLNGPNTGKKSQTIYKVIKKRSLLTRGEESLARIASLAKQGDLASHTVNTKNFVFHYIDPCIDNNTSKKESVINEEEEEEKDQTKPRKRKMSYFPLTSKKRRK